ncbi:MAG: cell division protein FtsL [Oceanospirillaceae bacterium]|jgi:cell division protein FtsL
MSKTDLILQDTLSIDAEEMLLTSNEIGRPMIIVVILLVCIIISCISIVYQSYQFRQLFNTQQQIVAHRDELQVEWGQLLLEQSALGANSRVEKIAKRKLAMHVPKSKNIEMVSYDR